MENVDSIDAIKLIKDDVNPFHKYSSIILEIKEMMTRMWQVDPRHAFRESNSSADYLAKNAASSRVGNQVLVVPLSDVASLLLAYSMGIFYPRL
jgi:ribonuclease HI